MKSVWMVAGLVGALAAGQPGVTFGQQKVDLGKREYDANCAVCQHGRGREGRRPVFGRGRLEAACRRPDRHSPAGTTACSRSRGSPSPSTARRW